MEQVPIVKIGQTLFVSIQIDLQDESVIRLQEDLADELAASGAHGVIIDITAVAITLTELGLSLSGVRTALNAEKGLEILNGKA